MSRPPVIDTIPTMNDNYILKLNTNDVNLSNFDGNRYKLTKWMKMEIFTQFESQNFS
jgi:hypothetical protein